MSVPCGQCIGCRMAKASDWATRMHHEASLHEANSFLTLTYDDDHLPEDYSVSVREMQLFMKRLRKVIAPVQVRYFACGEYGDEGGRPHYHLVLFGYDFPDKVLWKTSPTGHPLYTSDMLLKCWPFGFHQIGNVTHQSSGYVARYALKKISGHPADEWYERVHPVTGVLCKVKPEFGVMSRRPGIGSEWFNQFSCDAFPSDFLIVDGIRKPVPRFYTDKLVEQEKDKVKYKRKQQGFKRKDNNTPERLAVREKVTQLRVETLKRSVE